MKNIFNEKIQLILSMLIFGTIGVFVRYIPLPSSVVAFARGIVGMIFLILFMLVRKRKPDFEAVKKNILFLILSGAALGINWVLLFEAYRYTTVATATLCYYLAPVFIIIVSPIFMRERITAVKAICVAVALSGMVCVSGVLDVGLPEISEMTGILFGICAAVFYATVVLINKKISGIGAYDKTVIQLGVSAVVVFVYILFTENISELVFTPKITALLILVGVVHTGIAYMLYFGALGGLKAQTAAIFSYIDPVAAIVLSWLILDETMSMFNIIGAVMILGSALMSEICDKKQQ